MTRASSSPLHGVAIQFCKNFEFWCALGILSAAWLYYPYCQSGPDFCVWRKLLGFSCPGCGLTRGVCFLVHGRWRDAVQFNPLSPVAGGILLSNFLGRTLKLLRAVCLGGMGLLSSGTARETNTRRLKHPTR